MNLNYYLKVTDMKLMDQFHLELPSQSPATNIKFPIIKGGSPRFNLTDRSINVNSPSFRGKGFCLCTQTDIETQNSEDQEWQERACIINLVLKQKEAADDALVHATDVQSDSSMSRSNSKLPSMGKYSPTLTSSNNIDEARWGHGMENTTTMLPPQHGEGKIVPASEISKANSKVKSEHHANPVSVHFAPLPSRDSNTNVNVGNGMAPAVRSQRTLSNTSSKSSGKRGVLVNEDDAMSGIENVRSRNKTSYPSQSHLVQQNRCHNNKTETDADPSRNPRETSPRIRSWIRKKRRRNDDDSPKDALKATMIHLIRLISIILAVVVAAAVLLIYALVVDGFNTEGRYSDEINDRFYSGRYSITADLFLYTSVATQQILVHYSYVPGFWKWWLKNVLRSLAS
eukprot:jgi/Bigna1/89935/estExt_fgenesh1_pg.C_580099